MHPFRHLTSVAQLSTYTATRDTVIVAYLDASAEALNASLTSKTNKTHSPFKAFYDTSVHFAQAPHFLSFQFLLVTSPTVAHSLEFTAINTLHLYRSMDFKLAYNVTTSTASGLISVLDKNAASATVALVSESNRTPLVTRLTSTNVSVLLFAAPVKSPRTFYPEYQEFRELALWFRACGTNYHRAFRDILSSSEERFEAQHFCCDYQDRDDFYFDDGIRESSTEQHAQFSYFGPHLPENQICRLKLSLPPSTIVSASATNNASRSCGSGRYGGRRGYGDATSSFSPLPPPSFDATAVRNWALRCQRYLDQPILCHRRLTKTEAGVVQDGVLAVPAFAGLSCRTNRTFGFRYIVKNDFPDLVRRFGIDDEEASLVILDNESEETFVLRRIEKSKDMGEFVANFSRKTLTPHRRSRAADSANEGNQFRHERCLKKSAVRSLSNSSSSSLFNVTKSCIIELSSDSLRSLLSLVDGVENEVLILFYAKTCGLCKTFNRFFLRLSKLFRDVVGFRLARIDVDENDLPINLTVSAVPAIIFFRGVNFSKVFRPGDDGKRQQYRSSRPHLSLPDLLSFVLRHVRHSAVRRKLASKLCDPTCLKNNLEDVRKSAVELRRRKDALVHGMLVINEKVHEAEREMLYQVGRCSPTEGKGDGKSGEEAMEGAALEECRTALETLTKRVQGFARRLELKGENLKMIERKMKTLTKMEAKIAWALYKQK